MSNVCFPLSADNRRLEFIWEARFSGLGRQPSLEEDRSSEARKHPAAVSAGSH